MFFIGFFFAINSLVFEAPRFNLSRNSSYELEMYNLVAQSIKCFLNTAIVFTMIKRDIYKEYWAVLVSIFSTILFYYLVFFRLNLDVVACIGLC